ncbi:DUF2510 domain-containing protein [Streptomyces sp. CNQ085]|uniref:DUF2510 domain-containing protein n=1 Tax=Streptomyces sp. CNQ085 TaxID=2886944 RepID=UPI001F510E1A|nr:DUF2510 domain-containing protein [Streptomyces sp. CNQ085]MCI0383932.1 DUF2510 domain-containing protein [Streptomyces sp. CNQ085]
MTTPPGWYTDPGHTGPGQAPERWWDGSAWTGHTRPAGAGTYDAHTGYAAYDTYAAVDTHIPYGQPSHSSREPGAGPSRGPLVAAVIAAAVAVSAALAGGLLLLGDTGGSGGHRAQSDTTAGADEKPGGTPPGGPGEDELDGEEEGEEDDSTPGTAVDRANGVSVPVPEGWKESETDDGIWMSSGSYPCPGDASLACVRAGVSLRAAEGPVGAGPRATAEADIVRHAEEAYDARGYGGIEEHEAVSSAEVTVAGRKGHRVRWRITNELEPDAYVESVAFPAPDGSGRMLLMRLGFDIHADAPGPGEMDRIVAGVRPAAGPGMEV